MDAKEIIARRVALELCDRTLVNLGIGLPTLVARYVPTGINVAFQSENGIIGFGAPPPHGMEDPNLTDAGGGFISALPGAVSFDSALSFSLIRGGHLDMTVLGGLQVDARGHLANWMVPGRLVPGMGGAMDLVTGARRVVVAMQHNAKGESKIVPVLTLKRENGHNLALALGVVLHRHYDAPRTRNKVHRASHPRHKPARHHPVRQMTARIYLQPTQYGHIKMSAPDQREAEGAVKGNRARQRTDEAATSIGQVRVLHAVGWRRTEANDAVLALEGNVDPRRHVTCNERWQPDSKVDQGSVAQLQRDAAGDDLLRVHQAGLSISWWTRMPGVRT